VQEVIAVKGRAEPEVVEVKLTHHGPIVSGLMGETTPMALRWVALDQTDMLGAVLGYDRAANWQEFRAALASWAAPAHNFVYADVDGHIAYFQAGWMPVRAKGYGIAPVPGWSGEYEWQRFLSLDELPQALDPASGWLGVANNLVVDETYPHFISADLENPCRATRLVELLTEAGQGQRSRLRRHAARHLQRSGAAFRAPPAAHPTHQHARGQGAGDPARLGLPRHGRQRGCHPLRDCPGLRAAHHVRPPPGRAGRRLRGRGSLAAGRHRAVPRPQYRATAGDPGRQRGNSVWLRDPETGIPQPKTELLHRALRIALRDLKAHLGDDMDTWTWGRLNRIHFAHPLGSVKPLHLLFNRGPYPMSGDQDTLLRASGKPAFPFQPVARRRAALHRRPERLGPLPDHHARRPVRPRGQPALRRPDPAVARRADADSALQPAGRGAQCEGAAGAQPVSETICPCMAGVGFAPSHV
jgi:penicillin G amidase